MRTRLAGITDLGTWLAAELRDRVLFRIAAAAAAGILVGCAYPPLAWSWMIWFALVPLLAAIHYSTRPLEAALHGLVAGTLAAMIATHPLLSASSWTGWALVTTDELMAMRGRQWWFLHGIWVPVSLWGGVFWAAFAAVVRAWQPTNPFVLVILASSVWIVGAEWLRIQTAWGFHWMLLGNAAADFTWVRQLASIGGVWLLSALVVAVNVAFFNLVARSSGAGHWQMPLAVGILFAVVSAGGAIRISSERTSTPGFTAAVLQFHQLNPTNEDYLPFGMQRAYRTLIRQSLEKLGAELRLLMLPESVGFGNVSLDGTRSRNTPDKPHFDVADWSETIQNLLLDRQTLLILGADTTQRGQSYNTLLAWTRDGLVGHYDKRRLVPFAEYQPAFPDFLEVRGSSQYEHGSEPQLIRHGELVIGPFICQEILFPGITRDAVRAGANILVSGGNDGVFKNAAVAEVHAKLARLRAAETGRYLVRAMKTGVSAVISPTGHELARSPSSDPVLLRARVETLSTLTPYVRFGDWPLLAAALSLALLLTFSGRITRQG